MRLLHTADLHLGHEEGRSLAALDALLEVAAREEVDALTVGGDLFDSATDADRLRPALRERFADNPFEVVVVPGNRDADAFGGNVDFGPDLSVLSTDPFETRAVGDGEVVGVPDRDRLGEELFFSLRDRDPEDAVVLVHCTVDVAFGADAAGVDEPASYFPVQKATLGELGYEFVLGGHLHADLYQTKLSNGGLFIYPGSPLSHSWAETGRRHAVLVDTDDDNVRPVNLDTYYRDRFSESVRPGEGYDLIDRVERWVDGHAEDCDLEVHVDGFIERDPTTFDERLRAVAGPATVRNETASIADALDHPIYADFVDRVADLDRSEYEAVDDTDQLERRVLETLARLIEANEVSGA